MPEPTILTQEELSKVIERNENNKRSFQAYSEQLRPPLFVPVGRFTSGTQSDSDWQETAAQRQGYIERWAYLPLRTGESFISNLAKGVGFIGELGYEAGKAVAGKPAFDNNFFINMGNDAWTQWWDGVDEKTKTNLPIYESHKYDNKSIMGQMLSVNFWANDFADGLGFMLSSWVPGMAFSKLGVASRLITQGMRIAKAGGKTASTISKFANGIDRIAATAFMTGQESYFEAYNFKKDMERHYMDKVRNQEVNPDTGKVWTMADTKNVIARNTRDVFLQNMVALAGSNFFEAGFFMPKAAKTPRGRYIDNALSFDKKTKVGRFLDSRSGRMLQKGVGGGLAEGLWEENIQSRIESVNKLSVDAELSGYDRLGFFSEMGQEAALMRPGGGRYPKEVGKQIAVGAILGIGGGVYSANKEYKEEMKKRSDIADAVNGSFTGLLDLTSYKKIPGNTIELTKEKDQLGNDVFVRTVKDGTSKEVLAQEQVGEDTFVKEAQANGLATSGGTYQEQEKTAFNKETNLPEVDYDKGRAKLADMSFASDLQDLIDLEENKDNPDERSLRFLYDTKFGEWVFANLMHGQDKALTERIDMFKNATPEEMAVMGFDPNGQITAIQRANELKGRVQELKKQYDFINRTFTPLSKDSKDITANNNRKLWAFRNVYRRAHLDNELLLAANDLSSAEAGVQDYNSLLSDINKDAYELQYELIRAAKMEMEGVQPDNMDRIAELENTIKSNKKQYKEDTKKDVDTTSIDPILDIDSADKARIEESLIAMADIQSTQRFLNKEWKDLQDMKKYAKEKPAFKDKKRPRLMLTKDTTIDDYIDYEGKVLTRERLRENLENVKDESMMLEIETEKNPIETAKRIIESKRRISEGLYGKLTEALQVHKAAQDRYDDIELRQDNGVDISEEEAQWKADNDAMYGLSGTHSGAAEIMSKLNTIKDDIVRPASYSTLQGLQKKIAETYITPARGVLQQVRNNVNFVDYQSVATVKSDLENIKRLFEERKDILDNKEFKGFMEELDSMIAELDSMYEIIEKRAKDVAGKDAAIVNDAVTQGYSAIGIDMSKYDKDNPRETIADMELVKAIEDIIGDIVPFIRRGDYVALENLYQQIRSSKDDKAKEELITMLKMKRATIMYFDESEKTKGARSLESMLKIMSTLYGWGKPRGQKAQENYMNEYFKGRFENNPMVFLPEILNQLKREGNTDPFIILKANMILEEFIKNIRSDSYDPTRMIPKAESIYKGDTPGLVYNGKWWNGSSTVNLSAADTKAFLEDFIRKTFDVIAYDNLIDEINTTFNVSNQLSLEYKMSQTEINSLGKDKVRPSLFAPLASQRLAIWSAVKKIMLPFDKSKTFNGWTLLEGPAGTGKTNVFMKWLFKSLSLTIDNTSVYAIKDEAARTARNAAFGDSSDIAPRNLQQLTDDLKGNALAGKQYIIVDEIGQISGEELLSLADAIVKHNESRDNPLKVIAIGDPTQITETVGFSPLTSAVTIDYENLDRHAMTKNIHKVRPLSVLMRSGIKEINDVVMLYRDNYNEVSNEVINVMSTTDMPQNNNTPLFGVNGTVNFKEDIKAIVSRRNDGKATNDSRTRVIITTPEKVQEYNEYFALEIKDGILRVLDTSNAQSITADEVYVDIPRNKFGMTHDYNTVMYTATSRARYFLLLGNVRTAHTPNDMIGANEETKTDELNIEYLKNFSRNVFDEQKYVNGDAVTEDVEDTDEEDIKDLEDDKEKEQVPEDEIIVEDEDEDGVIPFSDDENIDDPTFIKAIEEDTYDDQPKETDEDIEYEDTRPQGPVGNAIRFVNTTIANFKLTGLYKAIADGSKVFFVKAYYTDRKTGQLFTKVSVLQKSNDGNMYREIAVIGRNDKAYDRFKDVIGQPTDGKGLLKITKDADVVSDINDSLLAQGTVTKAAKRGFFYNFRNAVQPKAKTLAAFKEHIVRRYAEGIWTDIDEGELNRRIVSLTKSADFKIFSDKEAKSMDVKSGWPYLLINQSVDVPSIGVPTSGLSAIKIRLSFRNVLASDKVTKDIDNFISSVKELNYVMGAPKFEYGNPLFNELVKRMYLNQGSMTMTDVYSDETVRKEIAKRLKIKEDVPFSVIYNEAQKIRTWETIVTDSKAVDTVKAVVESVYGKNTKGFETKGAMTILFNNLAKANMFSGNTALIDLRRKGDTHYYFRTGRALLGSGKGMGQRSPSRLLILQRFKQLEDRYKDDNAMLEDIKTHKESMMSNSKFGNITYEDLVDIRDNMEKLIHPVDRTRFNKDAAKYLKYVRNTFEAAEPSHMDVIIEDTSQGQDNASPNRDRTWRGSRLFSGTTGSDMFTRDEVVNYAKKFLPTTSSIEFVTQERMLSLNGNKFSWGLFKDGVIYLAEADNGKFYARVARHEVFHKVWNNFMTFEERMGVIADIRKEYPEMSIHPNESHMDYFKRIDEWFAQKWQDYVYDKKPVASGLQRFFDWLKSLFGYVRDNISALDTFFRRINEGEFYEREMMTDNSVEREYSSLDSYEGVEGYTPEDLYKLCYDRVAGRIGEQMYGAPERYVPMSFREAVAYIWSSMYDSKRDYKAGNEGMTERVAIAMVLTRKEGEKTEAFTDIFKDLLRDIFPTIRFSKNNMVEIQEDINEEENEETNNIEEQMDTEGVVKTRDAEQVDHEKNMTANLSSFCSSMYREIAGKLHIIPKNVVYRTILGLMEGVTFKSFEKTQKQINNNYKNVYDNGIGQDEITDYIRSEVQKAVTSYYMDTDKTMRFDDDSTFVVTNDGTAIPDSRDYGSNVITLKRPTGMNSSDFVIWLADEHGIDEDQAVRSYRQMVYGNLVNEIYTYIGSQYRQNIYRGGKKPAKGGFKYVYHSEQEKNDKFNITTNIRNKLFSAAYFDNFYDYIPRNILSDIINKNVGADRKAQALNHLSHALGYSVNFTVSDTESGSEIISICNELGFMLKDIQDVIDKMDTMSEESFQDSFENIILEESGRIAPFANYIHERLPKRTQSRVYRSADGKKKHFYTLSNYTMDQIRSIVRVFTLQDKKYYDNALQDANDIAFLRSPFFMNNPLNPLLHNELFIRDNPTARGRALNRIHGYINHDSMYNDDSNQYGQIATTNETEWNTVTRLFQLQFLSMIAKSGREKRNARYMQAFRNIGERNMAPAAEMDVLRESDIRKMVRQAIRQERARKTLGVDVYDDNIKKSYLAGIDVYDDNLSDEHYEGVVMAAIKEKAAKFYEELSGKSLFSNDTTMKAYRTLTDKGYVKDKLSEDSLWIAKKKREIKEGDSEKVIAEKKKAQEKHDSNIEKYVRPMSDIFYMNYYINGYFLNQFALGDLAQYKSDTDVNKYVQIAFANGYKGMVAPGKMRENFSIVVSEDVKHIMSKLPKKDLRKVFGKEFNATDGFGFITPKRYRELEAGFPPSLGLIGVQKPVYAGLDSNGIIREMKYATAVITDEMARKFPVLSELRDDMEKNDVDEFVFVSSNKIGRPAQALSVTKNGHRKIRKADVIQLSNSNYRLQLNPKKPLSISTHAPTQILNLINWDNKNTVEAQAIFGAMGKIMRYGREKVASKLRMGNKESYDPVADKGRLDTIRRYFIGALKAVPGAETIMRLLEHKTGKDYTVSMNIPVLADRLSVQFSSMLSKNVSEVRFEGSSLVLMPEYANMEGMKKLKITDSYVECYMPRILEGTIYVNDMVYGSEHNMLGFFVPGTGKHNALPLKVVGFLDTTDNVAILPGEITFTAGKDYDIDVVYVVRKTAATRDYDKDTYGIEKTIKKGEYIEGLNEDLVRSQIALLTSELSEVDKEDRAGIKDKIVGLEELYLGILKNTIVTNMSEALAQKQNLENRMMPIALQRLFTDEDDVADGWEEGTLNKIEKMIPLAVEKDANDVGEHIRQHYWAHSAKMLKGMLINFQKGLTLMYQSTDIKDKKHVDVEINKDMVFTLDGVPYDRAYKTEVENVSEAVENDVQDTISSEVGETMVEGESVSTGQESATTEMPVKEVKLQPKMSSVNIVNGGQVSHNFSAIENSEILANATIDDLKKNYLRRMNMSIRTVYQYMGMTAFGIPLYQQILLMKQPVIGNGAMQKALAAELEAISNNPDITTAELESTIAITNIEDATPEQRIILAKAYVIAKKMDKAGRDIYKIAKAAVPTTSLPSYYHGVVEIMDKIDEIFKFSDKSVRGDGLLPLNKGVDDNKFQLKDSFTFTNVQILTLAHVREGYINLKFQKTRLENMFFKHNKYLTEMSKSILGEIQKGRVRMQLGKKNSETIQKINEKFIHYVMSGMVLSGGYSFNTIDEAPYLIYNAKTSVPLNVGGSVAWSQRFIDKVEKLKAKYSQRNVFLDTVLVTSDKRGIRKLTAPAMTQMKPVEIERMQRAFMAMLQEESTTDLDRDFLKYAVLNYGIYYGGIGYTLGLPVQTYADLTYAIDKFFTSKFSTTQGKSEATTQYLSNISNHFLIMLGLNNTSDITGSWSFKDNIVKNGSVYWGVDTINGQKAYYDRKYKLESKEDYDRYPKILKDNDAMFWKEDNISDDSVYYVLIGYGDTMQGYQYSDLAEDGSYAASKVFTTKYKMLTMDNLSDISEVIEKEVEKPFEKGEIVIARKKSDIAGAHAGLYKITGIKTETRKVRKGIRRTDKVDVRYKIYSLEKVSDLFDTKVEHTIKERKVEELKSDISERGLRTILNKLNGRFGINYEIVNRPSDRRGGWFDVSMNGKKKEWKVYVNIAHADWTTPFHEYAHPLLQIMRQEAPELYNKLMTEVKTKHKTLLDELKADYPGMDERLEEAAVRVIAETASTKVVTKTGIIWQVIAKMKQYLRTLFTLPSWKNFIDMKDNLTLGDIGMFLTLEGNTMTDPLTRDMFSPYTKHFNQARQDDNMNRRRIRSWNDNNGIWWAQSKDEIDRIYNELTKFFEWGVSKPRYHNGNYSIVVKKPAPIVIESEEQKILDDYYKWLSDDEKLSNWALSAQEGNATQAPFRPMSQYVSSAKDIGEYIERENREVGLKLEETKDINRYVTKTGKILGRLTEFIMDKFSFAPDSRKYAEKLANRRFSENTDKITSDGRYKMKDEAGNEMLMTREDLVQHYLMNYETSRMEGKVAHWKMQLMYEKDPAKIREIEMNLTNAAQGIPGVRKAIDLKKFAYLDSEENRNMILRNMKVNYFEKDLPDDYKDKVYAELMLVSEELGLATTADLVVVRPNGNVSLYDYKAGEKFFSDDNIVTMLRYGDRNGYVQDTKQNRGKLELTLRAFMMKMKMPEIRFEDIAIVHFDATNIMTRHDVNVTEMLGIIEDYVRDSNNGVSEYYKKWKSMGLFDADTYGGIELSLIHI